ncbi:HNH endonuclease [Acinetobacter pseudolwoffii]|uniref:HNH endonuclease n=1 Tax=Acinetobacter pseudolwoffii TaxID=2053287 RepID=UPI000AA38C49|nr:HNH endonuclease signature motif containing protein [Acinetobacter pseudolwoffii]
MVYKAFIKISSKVTIDFDDEFNLNTIILALSKSFDYLNFNQHLEAGFHGIRDEQAIQDVVNFVQELKPEERPKLYKFSLATKTILRQNFNIHNQNFCRICDGLLYSSSTEVDHRIAMSMGGQGHLDNAVLLHPYCNRFKSDRTEEEARAALFGV